MATNKVILNGEVKIDLTKDTVTENDVVAGKTFHGADGVEKVGVVGGLFIPSFDLNSGYDSGYSAKGIDVVFPEGTTKLDYSYLINDQYSVTYHIYWPESLKDMQTSRNVLGTSNNRGYYVLHTNYFESYAQATTKENAYDYGDHLYSMLPINENGQILFTFNFPEGCVKMPSNYFSYEFFGDSYWDYSGIRDYDLSLYHNTYSFNFPTTMRYISLLGQIGSNYSYDAAYNIKINATTPPEIDSIYYSMPPFLTILVPKGALEAYSNATNWSDLTDYILEDDSPVTFELNTGEIINEEYVIKNFTIDKPMTWQEFIEKNPESGFSVAVNPYGDLSVHYNNHHVCNNNYDYVVPSSYIRSIRYTA
jgi:hypothetical protein